MSRMQDQMRRLEAQANAYAARPHCDGQTCKATRDASRGGKDGQRWACLCACPRCIATRRGARANGSEAKR